MDDLRYPVKEHREANITMWWSLCKEKTTALTTAATATNDTLTKLDKFCLDNLVLPQSVGITWVSRTSPLGCFCSDLRLIRGYRRPGRRLSATVKCRMPRYGMR
jgi:hypothetical protein